MKPNIREAEVANPSHECGSEDEYLETSAVYIARF
jgi:hypothetical protein